MTMINTKYEGTGNNIKTVIVNAEAKEGRYVINGIHDYETAEFYNIK